MRTKFEPRDLWIGVYWKYHNGVRHNWIDFYVCVIPMFPIIFRIKWKLAHLRKDKPNA